jgi:hypothetical protein
MLTISKSTWLAGTLAAVVALAAGIMVAATLTSTGPAGSAGIRAAIPPEAHPAVLAAQAWGECGDGNSDPYCRAGDVWRGSDRPPATGGGGGGGSGLCTWGDGTVLVGLAAQGNPVTEFECYQPGLGGWFDGNGCFWSPDFPVLYQGVPQEPPGAPESGKTWEDGQYYWGSCYASLYEFNGELGGILQADINVAWFDFGDAPTITPEEVAIAWLAEAPLTEVQLRLAPPETGVGVVNLPVWLGVDEGDMNSWGPLVPPPEHCIQGVCVTIYAQVVSVDWSMGDGGGPTCDRDDHEVWQRGMDYLAPGPYCHHYYRRSSRDQPDGTYQITATSHWEVEWFSEASGEGDVLTTELTAEAFLQVDEIQVLTR